MNLELNNWESPCLPSRLSRVRVPSPAPRDDWTTKITAPIRELSNYYTLKMSFVYADLMAKAKERGIYRNYYSDEAK